MGWYHAPSRMSSTNHRPTDLTIPMQRIHIQRTPIQRIAGDSKQIPSFKQTKIFIHRFDPVHDDDDRVTAMEGWSGPISTAILSDGSISLSSLCTDPASSSSVEPVLRCSAASAVRTPRVNHNSIFHLSTIRTAPLPSAVSRSGTAPAPHIHAPAYRRRPSGTYDYMYIASLL